MLFYKTYGSKTKPPVVLVHGLGGNCNIFCNQLRQYAKHFYVIAIDLPGHGQSPKIAKTESFSFEKAARSVIDVLDELKIKKAVFVGVSLGTVIIHSVLTLSPERVEKAVLAGAITSHNIKTKVLNYTGIALKRVMPYMWLYRLGAYIIMPRRGHAASRTIFIEEAKKLGYSQFIRWFSILGHSDTIYPKMNDNAIPKLYILGEEDHVLLRAVKKDIQKDKSACYHVLANSGHLCNIDQAQLFNEISIDFITSRSVSAVS
ncbi:alpha/beta hydrolase [Bacillus sp. 165]|uniref:alpha/beta fold hydrolase n=1 Tax=Bacillus sp. 165 TaxID=1529117 RepID=UPI001ADB48A4|nr:alpha/beta hydrolase [Bacillus sp. 165]MBO9128109.1 alpha/beta hydrolase [Bacillus sp. 165]